MTFFGLKRKQHVNPLVKQFVGGRIFCVVPVAFFACLIQFEGNKLLSKTLNSGKKCVKRSFFWKGTMRFYPRMKLIYDRFRASKICVWYVVKEEYFLDIFRWGFSDKFEYENNFNCGNEKYFINTVSRNSFLK